MFENFPYVNFHDLNLDWIIQKVKEAYSPDNPPDNMVLSVNGETGDVVLYQSENVVFPDVTSDQWRMVRSADGHTTGVLFNQNYMYVMYDNVADRVYTMNHPPEYPVTSVDGETGAVRVFPNAASRLPDVTEDYTNIRRQIRTDNTDNVVGIELKQNKAYRMKDASRYEIFDSGNPPPYPVTSVNGETGAIVIAIPFLDIESDDILFSEQASGHTWSLGRETQDGTASIQLVTNSTKAEAYVDFYDGEGLTFTKKLLTADDIPSSSGVVSVNGNTGVVTLYGDTMPIESGSAYSVKDVTDALDTRLTTAEGAITHIKSDIAFVEDTDNATHNISAGQFVIWKGSLYTALSNIVIGAGLSASNLSAVPDGGLNSILSKMTPVSYTGFTIDTTQATGTVDVYIIGYLCYIRITSMTFTTGASGTNFITGLPKALMQNNFLAVSNTKANTAYLVSKGEAFYILTGGTSMNINVTSETESYSHAGFTVYPIDPTWFSN